MNGMRIAGIVLLAVGVVLLIFGINASQSLSEQLGESVTGRFSDKTTWMIVGGIACIIGGGLLATFGGGRKGIA